jgi:aryl-alcohol dehydrogenase-like predicted oxidoreductase
MSCGRGRAARSLSRFRTSHRKARPHRRRSATAKTWQPGLRIAIVVLFAGVVVGFAIYTACKRGSAVATSTAHRERHPDGAAATRQARGSRLLTGKMTRERIASLPEDDWRTRDARFRESQPSAELALVGRTQSVAERHGTTPRGRDRLDIRNRAGNGAIAGFRHTDQVEPIVGAANLELSDDDVAAIEGTL